ncbi:MAG: hypothetical protein K8Q92_07260 [Methylophilales bacterium]|nr:hypothetical protein [Methylophilales bacterium]
MDTSKVTIIQAYEAPAVPGWIARCLASVREWAALQGHDYHFSPEFWRYSPDWFRRRCGTELGPMTDVARLYMMKEQFERGVECAVWIDADVLVFDPQNLNIPTEADFFGIEEVTVLSFDDGSTQISPPGVNGALLGARRDSSMFDIYLDAVESVVRDYPELVLPRTVAGPPLLTQLAKSHNIECLTTVGLFTPNILNEIALGIPRLPAIFAKSFGHKVAAANLCHFYRDFLPAGTAAQYDALMHRALDQLITTKGDVVNLHFTC